MYTHQRTDTIELNDITMVCYHWYYFSVYQCERGKVRQGERGKERENANFLTNNCRTGSHIHKLHPLSFDFM